MDYIDEKDCKHEAFTFYVGCQILQCSKCFKIINISDKLSDKLDKVIYKGCKKCNHKCAVVFDKSDGTATCEKCGEIIKEKKCKHPFIDWKTRKCTTCGKLMKKEEKDINSILPGED
jgi:ribosomal protein S27E